MWHYSAVGTSLNLIVCTQLTASQIRNSFYDPHRLWASCDAGLKIAPLPGSSGMLTQLPPSACLHSQMGTSLSWVRQHMFTPFYSLTCWRKVSGNVCCVVTSMQNFRDKHVDGICEGFVPLPFRNLGMSHFWSPQTHHLQPGNGSRCSYWSEGMGIWEQVEWHDGWEKHDLELRHRQCAKSIETGL